MNGPFPAGENDKAIFEKPGGLKSKLKGNQAMIADEGYQGVAATRNSLDPEDLKDMKGRGKGRQETINARLKNFSILRGPFRTCGSKHLERHKAVMEACLVIIQYELEHGASLMKV